MTQLQVKLHQPWARGYIEAGAVATVRLLADSSGTVTKAGRTQQKPVAISGGNGEFGPYTVFDLPGGGYYGIDITRPRGPDISQEYLIQEGEVRKETITMAASPHEYLGWQQYAGIVRSDPYRRETDRSPDAPASTGIKRLDTLVLKGRSRIEGLYRRRAQRAPRVFAAGVPASGVAWALVKEAAGGGGRDWTRVGDPLDWAPQGDAEFAVWFRTMPSPGEGIDLVDQLRTKNAPRGQLDRLFPRWLSFQAGARRTKAPKPGPSTSGPIDLASVPWSWWGEQPHQDEEIRLLYDLVRPSPVDRRIPGHLTISVQDRRWSGLLEFLASGRLNRAGDVFDGVLRSDDAESALYGKFKGPLVAVAGGIVLIAQAKSTEVQRWDGWLENLSNWFPGIPDGPILLGCRRVQQAKSSQELLTAYGHLREGIERGIPFFSASIRMLALALAQIGGDIPDAEESGRYIAPVSSRIDPDQPFTVIRL